MTAASSVLSVIYKIHYTQRDRPTKQLNTTRWRIYWQLVQITRSLPAEGTEAGCRRRHRDDRCSSQVGRLLRKRLRYGPYNASGRTRRSTPDRIWMWAYIVRQRSDALTTTVISCVIGSLVSLVGSS